jgi:hypothetical protein
MGSHAARGKPVVDRMGKVDLPLDQTHLRRAASNQSVPRQVEFPSNKTALDA